MASSRPPLSFGLTLGIRLFLLLIAIIAPALMSYYVITFSAFENLHRQEIDTLIANTPTRVMTCLATAPVLAEADRDALSLELKRIVEQPDSVESLAVFIPSTVRGLELLTSSGPTPPN